MKKHLKNTFIYRRYKSFKAFVALRMYGNPSADMIVIGVTGTDGKTTTSSLIHHILHTCLGKSVFIGTTGILIGKERMHGVTKMTSYDPMQLQQILAKARDAWCKYAVLEVSSHGLEQKRFNGITFRGAVLTNITPEHLDYHKTMEHYASAKQKLFQLVEQNVGDGTFAVLPRDDLWGQKRYKEMNFNTKLSYGFTDQADIFATHIDQKTDHTLFTLQAGQKSHQIKTNLVGKFNVANIMAARGATEALGVESHQIIKAIDTFERVSGRQEHMHISGVDRYVDYAHTPNGLQVTLEFLQSIKKEWRVICIFGAPGQRDRGKRPVMGEVVQKWSDIIIVTDDDPAAEDRRQIIDDIQKWITKKKGDNYRIIPNRRDAVHFVAQLVQPGDAVLMAGIGHQDVLFTNYGTIPRSEKEIVREATVMSSV